MIVKILSIHVSVYAIYLFQHFGIFFKTKHHHSSLKILKILNNGRKWSHSNWTEIEWKYIFCYGKSDTRMYLCIVDRVHVFLVFHQRCGNGCIPITVSDVVSTFKIVHLFQWWHVALWLPLVGDRLFNRSSQSFIDFKCFTQCQGCRSIGKIHLDFLLPSPCNVWRFIICFWLVHVFWLYRLDFICIQLH